MKLNKILCVMIALFAINTAAHAMEISVGASFGGGLPLFRGTDATDMIKGFDKIKGVKKTTFALLPQINVMFEFLPFLALETGLGFKYSTLSYNYKILGAEKNTTSSFTRSEIYIPVMLRGQFEYSLGVTYLSAGVKLGIPVVDYYQKNQISTADPVTVINAAPFTLDIAFALGQEFRVATSHYVGVRLGYDLNVIRPYATSAANSSGIPSEKDTMLDDADWFQDDLTVAFTYRYVFNSKWN